MKNGRPSGVRKAVRGQPPAPSFISCVAVMNTWSRTGCCSRSTLTGTKWALMNSATSGFSNDSLPITWHQWHDA